MSYPADSLDCMEKDHGSSVCQWPEQPTAGSVLPCDGEHSGADRIGGMSYPVGKIRGMNNHQVTAAQWPDQLAHLADEPELVNAWEYELAQRQAHAAKVESLLAYRTRKLEQNSTQHTFTRQAVEKAIIRDAAAVLGLTEPAVRRLLATAEFLVEKLPKTWAGYSSGVIDHTRAVKAAQAVEDIAHRQDLLPVIDAEISRRAPVENAASLDAWLKRRVPELDTAAFQDRYDRAYARRYVAFHHRGDGMSRIDALIPTLIAAGVEQQLYALARNAPRTTTSGSHGGRSDHDQDQSLEERTLTQRIADAFTLRLHSPQHEVAGTDHNGVLSSGASGGSGGPGTPDQRRAPVESSTAGGPSQPRGPDEQGHLPGAPGPVNAKIGILVPVETLTGDSQAPGVSWDRSWSLPAGTIRQIATDPKAQHDWYLVGTGKTALPSDSGTLSPSAETQQICTVAHPRTPPLTTSSNANASGSDRNPSTDSGGEQPNTATVDAAALRGWIQSTYPGTENLLTKAYRSRTAQGRQRDAILIRDGTCTRPGCTNPGWQAEIDHTQSYETGGRTIGSNLKTLCRDCHSIKATNSTTPQIQRRQRPPRPHWAPISGGKNTAQRPRPQHRFALG